MIGLATNVLTIAVCATVLFMLTHRSIQPAPSGSSEAILAPDLAPDIEYASSDQTLVLAMRSDCPYCQRSIPFYRRAVEAARKSGKTRVIAVFPMRDASWSAYLANQGLAVTKSVQRDLRSIHVTATPTLFLIDRAGKVRRHWIGVLPDHQQSLLLSML
jgi:hypothetical protein